MVSRLARSLLACAFVAAALTTAAFSALDEDWPQFLGPHRDGSSEDAELARRWAASGLKVAWRARVGDGYAGVAVAGDRLFSMDRVDASEFVFALRVRDGSTLWRVRTGTSPPDVYGGLGPRVTPSVDGSLVLITSAEGDLIALDATTGTPVWRRALAADHGWRPPAEGAASSALVADGRVYVVNGGSGGRALAAFDRRTGVTLWVAQDDRPSYSSPLRWDQAGVSQALFLTGSTLFSVDPASGRLHWQYPWRTYDFVNVATPLRVPPDRVFVSSGYDQGSALLLVKKQADGSLAVSEIWKTRELRNHFNNSVLHAGLLCGFDNAILKALDVDTGRAVWRERGFGQGSLLRIAGHLAILSEEGEIALAEADAAGLRVKSRQPVLSGRCWTPPAVAQGRVFLRSPSEIVALLPGS